MPTHWKKLNNPDYLGAYAFDPGEEKTVTIAKVGTETVTGTDGKREECIVAHFVEKGVKPMILNVTNCTTITNILGTPYIENWVNKKISLHVESVRAFGGVVDAVRVMKKISTAAGKKFICEACGKEIAGLTGFTPEQISAANKKRYGKALCVECGQKRKAEIEAEKAAIEAERDAKMAKVNQVLSETASEGVAEDGKEKDMQAVLAALRGE